MLLGELADMTMSESDTPLITGETMDRMKFAAILVVTIKLMIAVPCIGWGLLIGVIGFGPEGFVPFHLFVRWAALCAFFGGLAMAFPFSLVHRQARFCWIIVALSALPLCLGGYSLLTAGMPRIHDGSDVIGLVINSAICLLFPLLTLVDLFLAKSLRAKI